MINISNIPINNINDYDNIRNAVKEEYFHQKFIEELKSRIGNKSDLLIVEYPYYDKDYLSTYYSFYSRLFKNLPRECYRIHILGNNNYLGYITLRPTISYTKVGKSYIAPEALLNKGACVLTSDFEVNILGNKEQVKSFPWMYQETDISVCAHVAVWSIIRYYGNKYNIYADKRMMDIVNYTPNGLGRNIPSKGLVLTQIADIFRKNNFHPIIVQKRADDRGEFFEEVYSYIESGIPMVAAITKYGHAVTIIGHGKPKFENLDNNKNNIISSTEVIDSVIINDDNFMPYLEVQKRGLAQNKIQSYDLEDIDYVIVPLYDRMMLGYWSVRKSVETLINSKSYDFNDQNVVRIYITSSNSLKNKMNSDNSIDSDLKCILAGIMLPKFVWCVDISSPEEYKNGIMSCKIIIDTTAGTYESDPWLLIQDKKQIVYRDADKYYYHQKNINAYPIYRNNLEEVL